MDWYVVAGGGGQIGGSACAMRQPNRGGPRSGGQVTRDADGHAKRNHKLSGVKHGVKNYSDSVYSG